MDILYSLYIIINNNTAKYSDIIMMSCCFKK